MSEEVNAPEDRIQETTEVVNTEEQETAMEVETEADNTMKALEAIPDLLAEVYFIV